MPGIEIWKYYPLLEPDDGGPKVSGKSQDDDGGKRDRKERKGSARDESEFVEAETFMRSEALRVLAARGLQLYRDDIEQLNTIGGGETGLKANVSATVEALQALEQLMASGLEDYVVRSYRRIAGGKLVISAIPEAHYDPSYRNSIGLDAGEVVRQIDIEIQRGTPPPPDPYLKSQRGGTTQSVSRVVDVAEPFYRVGVSLTNITKENRMTPPEFTTADGIVMKVGQRGTCKANGLKYVGFTSFTADHPIEIDRDPAMADHVTGLYNAIQTLPLMPK